MQNLHKFLKRFESVNIRLVIMWYYQREYKRKHFIVFRFKNFDISSFVLISFLYWKTKTNDLRFLIFEYCRYSDFCEKRAMNVFIFYYRKTTHQREKSVEILRKIRVFHENLFFSLWKNFNFYKHKNTYVLSTRKSRYSNV